MATLKSLLLSCLLTQTALGASVDVCTAPGLVTLSCSDPRAAETSRAVLVECLNSYQHQLVDMDGSILQSGDVDAASELGCGTTVAVQHVSLQARNATHCADEQQALRLPNHLQPVDDADKVPGNVIVRYKYGLIVVNRFDATIGTNVIVYGEYDEDQTEVQKVFAREGSTVIDVGAHYGPHTLAMARMVGVNGKVHAFEVQAAPRGCSLLIVDGGAVARFDD